MKIRYKTIVRPRNLGWQFQTAARCLLAFAGLALSGCWDNHELEDLNFISVIGADPGTGNNLRVSYQYEAPMPPNQSGAGASQQHNNIVATFMTPSFGAARNIANITTDRQLTLVQTKAVVIGEELAKKRDTLALMESLVREREFRRDISVVTSIDPAEVVMRNSHSKIGSTAARYLENLRNQPNYTGMYPNTSMNSFLVAHESEDSLPITPLIGMKPPLTNDSHARREDDKYAGQVPLDGGDNPLEAMGAEVYRAGLACGRLSGDEVRIYLMVRGQAQHFVKSVTDPEKLTDRDAAELEQRFAPHTAVRMEGRRLHVDVDVPLLASLISTTSKVDYVQNTNNTRVLEHAFNQQLQSETVQLMHRCQTEFQGDIFGFGGRVRWRFLTEPQWKAFHYREHFLKAIIHVRYHVKFTTFGKQKTPIDASNKTIR